MKQSKWGNQNICDAITDFNHILAWNNIGWNETKKRKNKSNKTKIAEWAQNTAVCQLNTFRTATHNADCEQFANSISIQ